MKTIILCLALPSSSLIIASASESDSISHKKLLDDYGANQEELSLEQSKTSETRSLETIPSEYKVKCLNLESKPIIISINSELIKASGLLSGTYQHPSHEEYIGQYIDLSTNHNITTNLLELLTIFINNDESINELSLDIIKNLIGWIDYLQLNENLTNRIINLFNIKFHILTVDEQLSILELMKQTIPQNLINNILCKYLTTYFFNDSLKHNFLEYKVTKTFTGHASCIRAISILPNGNIVSGSQDGTIKIWNPITSECINTLTGHTEAVLSIATLPNGNIVSGSYESIKIWNSKTGECIKTFIEKIENFIWSISILPNSNIISQSYNYTIKIWNSETYECISILAGHTDIISSCSTLHNGLDFDSYTSEYQKIVSGSFDNTIKIWNNRTKEYIKTLTGHKNWIRSIAILPNNNIVSGSDDNTIKIWNIETGECINTLTEHTNSIESIAILPNGNIISKSDDNTIKIWDSETGECIKTIRTNHSYSCGPLILSYENIIYADNNDIIKIMNLTASDKLINNPETVLKELRELI